MKFPWNRNYESRAGTTFTDAQIAALTSKADGVALVTPTATGALEACAGVVGRGFAAAEVGGRPMIAAALTPDVLEMTGRALMRRGEILFYIDTAGDRLMLLPATSYNIMGGPNPDSWEYDLMLAGPSGTRSLAGNPDSPQAVVFLTSIIDEIVSIATYYMHYHVISDLNASVLRYAKPGKWLSGQTSRHHSRVSAESVIHVRYAVDPVEPWRGCAPLDVARQAGRLSSETVNALADESSTPVGQLLGLPVDGNDPTVAALKSDMKASKGRMAFLQTGDWGNVGAGYTDIVPKRYGPAPTEHLVDLFKHSSAEVYAACGFNPSLFVSGDSASLRESWRLALFGVISPLAVKVEAELTSKLATEVTLGFSEMKASDIQGRARSLKAMVEGGMPLPDAIAVSGLMME